jgi:copper(I)-binding protein
MKAALAATLLLCAPLPAAAAAQGAVQALDPWSRPAAAGTNAAGYLTLVNKGPADALVGADSPAAEKVEMHASKMSNGVMSMAAEQRVPLPAGGRVSFSPGGRHLMLVGLKRGLHIGDRVPATLRFASGKALKVEFAVRTGAASSAQHMDHMDNMPGM